MTTREAALTATFKVLPLNFTSFDSYADFFYIDYVYFCRTYSIVPKLKRDWLDEEADTINTLGDIHEC